MLKVMAWQRLVTVLMVSLEIAVNLMVNFAIPTQLLIA